MKKGDKAGLIYAVYFLQDITEAYLETYQTSLMELRGYWLLAINCFRKKASS